MTSSLLVRICCIMRPRMFQLCQRRRRPSPRIDLTNVEVDLPRRRAPSPPPQDQDRGQQENHRRTRNQSSIFVRLLPRDLAASSISRKSSTRKKRLWRLSHPHHLGCAVYKTRLLYHWLLIANFPCLANSGKTSPSLPQSFAFLNHTSNGPTSSPPSAPRSLPTYAPYRQPQIQRSPAGTRRYSCMIPSS